MNPLKCLRALFRRPTKRGRGSSGQGRVTRNERVLMARLRTEGFTLDEVGRRLGRTRKTIRRALGPGEQAVPEPPDDEVPELPTPSERSTGGRERLLTPAERREHLLDGLEPRLIDAANELFDAKPQIVEDLIRKTMHMPERTFDMILEEVAISQLESSSEDRRRVAEAYLRKWEGRTRSEMDVVIASFELFGALLDRVQADAWPRAIGGVLGNGEVHKIVEALGSLKGATQHPAVTENAEPTLEVSRKTARQPKDLSDAEKARMREVIAAPLHVGGTPEAPEVPAEKSQEADGPVSAT